MVTTMEIDWQEATSNWNRLPIFTLYNSDWTFFNLELECSFVVFWHKFSSLKCFPSFSIEKMVEKLFIKIALHLRTF